MSIASRCVARSSGSATEKLAVVGAVAAIIMEQPRRLCFCFARDLFENRFRIKSGQAFGIMASGPIRSSALAAGPDTNFESKDR